MKAEDKDLAVLETSKAQEKAVKREGAVLKAGGIQKQPYLLGEHSCHLQVLCSLPRLLLASLCSMELYPRLVPAKLHLCARHIDVLPLALSSQAWGSSCQQPDSLCLP